MFNGLAVGSFCTEEECIPLSLSALNRDHLKYVLLIRKPVEQKSVRCLDSSVGNPHTAGEDGTNLVINL